MIFLYFACAGNPTTAPPDGGGDCRPTTEIPYDGIDQDCDGVDLDDQDSDGFPFGEDCDDTDPYVFPGAIDVPYDGIDQDCDGVDRDDVDGDGAPYAIDCDDENPLAFPGNQEVCDGVDNDCNGDVDSDAVDRLEWPVDLDADGFAGSVLLHCQNQGFEELTDCDDADPAVHPAASEVCDNGTDDNCDGYVDEMLVGGTHESIEEAILDLCHDGDTVWIGAGTWYETLTIDRPLVLRGEDQVTSIIDGSDCRGGDCTILSLLEGAAGSEVRELTLQYGVGVSAGAVDVGADEITLESLIFQYNYGGLAGGVSMVDQHDLSILNCQFQYESGGPASAVYLAGALQGVVVDGCAFDQGVSNWGAFVQHGNHTGEGEYSVILRNSTITSNNSTGVLTTKPDWLLENNVISGNSRAAASSYAGGFMCQYPIAMRGNLISGNSPTDVLPSMEYCSL